MIYSNEELLARVLAARRAAGYQDIVQWWLAADQMRRVALARYYEPVRALLGGLYAVR